MSSSNNEIGKIMSLLNSHGLAVIKSSKGYGLIDRQMNVVLDCSYHFEYNRCGPDFDGCYLVIQRNGCYGLINECGKFVLPCKYPGVASLIYASNSDLLDYGFVCITDGHKYGLVEIANSNQCILNCVYDKIVFHSNNQYIWQDFLYPDIKRYIVGYLNQSCTIIDILSHQICIINKPNCNIEIIYNLYTIVVSSVSKDDILKYYILSMEGELILDEIEYDGLATFNDKYVQVRRGNCWGIFDLSERKEIIPCQYFYREEQKWNSVHFCPFFIVTPKEDLILVTKDGLKWGYIDKNNNMVIDCMFENARPFSEGIAAVYQHFYWRFINQRGEFIGGKYMEILDFKDGMAGVKEFDKWGYIDKNGCLKIPFRFSEVKSFSEGLAPVAFKIRWGYINKNNETVIPFRYKWAYPFNDGIASVNDYGGNGHIDKNGKLVDYDEYKQDNSSFCNYEDERWDALTDGMEGDNPGSGVDYDLLGFD